MTNGNHKHTESSSKNPATLSCRETQALISESLDHRLQSSLDRGLRKHIFSCPPCRKVYQDLLALQALVKGQPEDQVSPDFMEVLERRIASGEGTPTAALDSPIPLARKLKLFSSGMATAAALLLSAWLVLDEITPPPIKPENAPIFVQPGNQKMAMTPGKIFSSRVSDNNSNIGDINRRSFFQDSPMSQKVFQGTMNSINNEKLSADAEGFPSIPYSRSRRLTPLSKTSAKTTSSPGLQPENLEKFRRHFQPHTTPLGETPFARTQFPGDMDLVDPSLFALGLFKGTLKSLEDLKANTQRFKHFPPHKAIQEILKSAQEARDCTSLLLKLDRRLLDLNPANGTWLKKVHHQLQKVTELGTTIQSDGKGVRDSLQKIQLLLKDIQTKDALKSRVTIRLKFESNLRDSLLGTGMPPPSLQRVLKVISRASDGDPETPSSSFFLFGGSGELRIFVLHGKQK